MNTQTVTKYNSVEIADQINKAFEENANVKVNGSELYSRWGNPVARSWNNGTVSIHTRARTVKHGTKELFFKVGSTITITN